MYIFRLMIHDSKCIPGTSSNIQTTNHVEYYISYCFLLRRAAPAQVAISSINIKPLSPGSLKKCHLLYLHESIAIIKYVIFYVRYSTKLHKNRASKINSSIIVMHNML